MQVTTVRASEPFDAERIAQHACAAHALRSVRERGVLRVGHVRVATSVRHAQAFDDLRCAVVVRDVLSIGGER